MTMAYGDQQDGTNPLPWPGYPQVPSFLQQQKSQGGGLAGGVAGGLNNIVRALMLGAMAGGKSPNTAGLGRYEGQVASPANPFSQGTYGMQSDPSNAATSNVSPSMTQATAPPSPWGGGAQPVPYTGASTAPAPQASATPWGSGAQPVPYTDPTMTALFSQPPLS